MPHTHTSRGFIALISSIIISMILVLVVTAGGFSGFMTRWNALESDDKSLGEISAKSCVRYAILKLQEDSAYVGNEIVLISENSCRILPFISISGQTIIQVQVISNRTYTNLKVFVNTTNLSIVSWQEIPILL